MPSPAAIFDPALLTCVVDASTFAPASPAESPTRLKTSEALSIARTSKTIERLDI
jgi:hypothetical protein